MLAKSFSTIWTKKPKLTLALIYLVGLLSFAVLLFFTHRLANSDDYAFQKQILPFPTVLDWVDYRYHSWSGRLFAESFVYIFSPLALIFWKIVSFVLYALFSLFVFLYYCLFTKKRSRIKDYSMLTFALLLPLLLDTQVLTEGMLWVTGSMNYFWLVAFATVAFYPIVYYLTRKRAPHWAISVLALLSGIIAASSQEQIGAVIIVLSLIALFYIFIINKMKTFPYFITLFCTVFIGSFLVGITAPGNHVRIEVETIARLPDFYTTPILEHAVYAYRWFLDSLINRLGFLLVFTWIPLLILFFKKYKDFKLDKRDWTVIVILSVSCLMLCLKGYTATNYWFDFHSIWKAHTSAATYGVLIPWTIALITTLFAPLALYRKSNLGLLLSTLFAAVLASTALITLSPTMYASGYRVIFVPSVILVFVIYMLLDKVFDSYRASGYTVLFAITCLGASQYLLLLQKAVH